MKSSLGSDKTPLSLAMNKGARFLQASQVYIS